jgi:hypothetical protein
MPAAAGRKPQAPAPAPAPAAPPAPAPPEDGTDDTDGEE